MLRSAFAVLAGFFVIVVGVLVTTPLVARVLGHETAPQPSAPYLTGNLVGGFGCALVGGWVSAWLAPSGALLPTGVLAALVLILGVTTAAQGGAARADQPQWYAWVLPFVAALGVVLGGMLGA